jgi:hypothetical protein
MNLKLESGLTYFIDSNGKRVCTGSEMGRRNVLPADTQAPIKLRLAKLRWVDGDYDEQGAYWGHGPGLADVFCAWDEAGVRIYIRGRNRESAKQGVWKVLPKAKFFR